MDIRFAATRSADSDTNVYAVMNQDGIPAVAGTGAVADMTGAAGLATRFAGKAGQIFEGFVERQGQVVRVALAGIGSADAADRAAALERAGGGLVARFLTSGETTLAFDLSGSGLSAADTATLLLGARLRGWRHDAYRTKLNDDQKISLEEIVVLAAPEGAEAAWGDAEAVAEGVEFTRELVTEPANVIYPESFVERCQRRALPAPA
jgi:leucyl aminopeptidase